MNGALIMDKPAGMTSHDVVARVRKIIRQKRVGHTGTLDPFATGVLVVLVGQATRLSQFLSGAEKEYEAVIRLGYATDTGDATGLPVQSNFTTEAQRRTEIHREEIETAMASLRGEIEQTPPMYSAKKIGGQKLYELARRGEEVERKAVRVTVSEFELINDGEEPVNENEDGTRELRVRVVCSAGTYIRTLAEEFGRRVGVGAHLAELRRARAGQFKIASAATLERLAELAQSGSIEQILLSPDAAVSHLPLVQLSSDEVTRTLHGIDMPIDASIGSAWPNDQHVRMRTGDGRLIAVGIYHQARKVIHPKVVIGNNE